MSISAADTISACPLSNTPIRVSASTHARLPVTSSSNKRLSKRNEAPNSNAAGSGSLLKRPDQRFAIELIRKRGRPGGLAGVFSRASRGRFDREPPDFDEAFRSGVVEPVSLFVSDQSLIVKRVRRLAADDAAVALEQLQANRAGERLLNLGDEGVDRQPRRRKPQAVINE